VTVPDLAYGQPLGSEPTPIPGLTLWILPVHGDARGWFKENWQREKMVAAGLPDLGPVQNNISFNGARGTTRGIHAEPWDKLVSVASGSIFGAWVDLREGPTFGAVFTAVIDPSRAIFVPRGVGNAFQTLEDATVYTYLVNDHWSPDAQYTFLNLADASVAIDWPVPLTAAEISEKDRAHPALADVVPMGPRKTLVLGAHGQLGSALRRVLGEAAHIEYVDREHLDVTAPGLSDAQRWRDFDVIINAAAMTAVDLAETGEGRSAAWAANAVAPARLAAIAAQNGITLVHVSSDYVFDGTSDSPYDEAHELAPLGVYAQSKAAGDIAVATAPRHYIMRTSWLVGHGNNFARTMARLAHNGVAPSVVDDQVGRLTFADDLASAIVHLLSTDAPFGTYNVTSAGEPASWAEVAREVFRIVGEDPARVTPVTTEQYFASATTPIAPRPAWSVLDLTKIESTGWRPREWREGLKAYLEAE
jgi:dTDP-4-dehydrorhamnose 3,5-epimerase